MKELKIALLQLYCGQSGKTGFYNNQSLGLAKAYEKAGHEVLVVFPDKEKKTIEEQRFSDKIKILYVPAKSLGVHSFYGLEFLLDYKIDLVHVNADNQAAAPKVNRFCKKHHIKVYNYVGTIYSDAQNAVKRLLMNYFTKRNIRCFRKNTVFAKTEAVRKELEAVGISHAKVVPVGLDFDIIPEISESKYEIRKELELPEKKKILLYVGRMAEYKKPLDALELLKLSGERYQLIAIGSGELKEAFLEKSQKDGLKEQVRYIEAVPNTEIHKYYKAADCFVNFNPQEIFGMSILEAMYQECPVVAKHAPGPDSIVEEGVCGYLCDTLEEMCICVDKADREMGIRGRDRVKTKFSWAAASEIILSEMKM